jgi:hypothetical protein
VYYLLQFPLSAKFEQFLSEAEFDLIMKRMRPWVVKCKDIEELGLTIDVVTSLMGQLKWGG